MIRPSDLPIGALERTLSDEILAFLKHEFATIGEELYAWIRNYYLEQGIGLAPYDVAILRFANAHLAGRRFIEIGAGMGQLSALLAASGFEAIAIEKTPTIAQTAQHLRDWLLVRSYPVHTLKVGWFPRIGGDQVADAVVVGISISQGMPEHEWTK